MVEGESEGQIEALADDIVDCRERRDRRVSGDAAARIAGTAVARCDW